MSIADVRDALTETLERFAPMTAIHYADNDFYELYLFSLVIVAAEAERGQISFRNFNGGLSNALRFRRAPGALHADGGFTHAVIEFQNREPLEAHIGIRVRGVSGQAHECDVGVLAQSECERSRRFELLPRSKDLKLAVEAKYYSDTLPLYLGRGVLGLARDFRNTPTVLASNIDADNIVAMILHHNHHANDLLTPASGNEDAFIRHIAGVFYKYSRG